MGINVKGAGGGRSAQGHGIGVGKNLEGGRRRAASNISSSTSSSSSTTSVWDTLVKRSTQGRRSNVIERHRHWSVSRVAGAGAQRAGAREAAPRYDKTRMQVQAAGNVTSMETLTLRMELTQTKTERWRQKKARSRREPGRTSSQG